MLADDSFRFIWLQDLSKISMFYSFLILILGAILLTFSLSPTFLDMNYTKVAFNSGVKTGGEFFFATLNSSKTVIRTSFSFDS